MTDLNEPADDEQPNQHEHSGPSLSRRGILAAGTAGLGLAASADSAAAQSNDGGNFKNHDHSGENGGRNQLGVAAPVEAIRSRSITVDEINETQVVSPTAGAAGVNAAIDALPPEGGVVEFRPGEYAIEEIIHQRKDYLVFRALGDVTLRAAEGFTRSVISNVDKTDHEYLRVEGIAIDGNSDNVGKVVGEDLRQDGIRASNTTVVSVEDCHIYDTNDGSITSGGSREWLFCRHSRFENAGALDHPTTDAHISAPSGNVHITNCYFDWTTDNAIFLNNCDSAFIAFNRFHDCFVNAFDDSMDNVRYIGNAMTGTPPRGNAWIYFATGGSRNITIRDNHWYDLGDPEQGDVDGPRYAIRSLSDRGDSIDNVTISGNTFELDGYLNRAIQWEAHGESITISENTVKESASNGIRVRHAEDVRVTDNTIIDANVGDSDYTAGLWLADLQDVQARGNSIRDTRTNPQMRYGVTLADANGSGDWAVLENNRVQQAVDGDYNVHLDYPHLRWNGFGYNEGDPNVEGQWNGRAIEGLHVRDTVNNETYLHNDSRWVLATGSGGSSGTAGQVLFDSIVHAGDDGFDSLQDAIDFADASGYPSVFVPPGTYEESIVVPTDIDVFSGHSLSATIAGQNNPAVTMDSRASLRRIHVTGDSDELGIEMIGNGATVRECWVVRDIGISGNFCGIFGNYLTSRDVTFANDSQLGIVDGNIFVGDIVDNGDNTIGTNSAL